MLCQTDFTGFNSALFINLNEAESNSDYDSQDHHRERSESPDASAWDEQIFDQILDDEEETYNSHNSS
jgi:hypothetical protein